MGVPPQEVLKTLMAEVDGRPVCVVVPSDREVSLKKLAAAFGGKSARMMKPADAERLTGYRIGGISPFGQRRKVPTAIEATALSLPEVFINGGQRGLQVRMSPEDARRVLSALAAGLVA
jgi:Cys-tRNA(Pro)/Cys-tRNA(Cys) deacylase